MVGKIGEIMCKKKVEVVNEKGLLLGGIGALPNTFQGLFNIWAKKGGRIMLGISKKEPIDTSDANNFETIVEIGGGAVPHMKVNGIVSAERFNNGITETVDVGDKVLTIQGGIITKVEDKK